MEGHDVRAKICILAKLAFGVTVDPIKVPCQGITQITSTDFEYAKLMGCTIKLVGAAMRLSNYGALSGCDCCVNAGIVVSLTLDPAISFSHFLLTTHLAHTPLLLQ